MTTQQPPSAPAATTPVPRYREMCPVCRHMIAVTDDGRFWAHGGRWGCGNSGRPAPTPSAAPAASTEPSNGPLCDPAGAACGTCGTERSADELTQAYSFSYEIIPGRFWCRDKEACYTAWVAQSSLSPAAQAVALGPDAAAS